MAIARYAGFALDCPDPLALAGFYADLLGWEVDAENDDDDWVDIRPPGGGNCISFQKVDDYRAPQWPEQEVPQQAHLDVYVDDIDAAEPGVIQLGATRHEYQPGDDFRVFLDPAGHPFCLCRSTKPYR